MYNSSCLELSGDAVGFTAYIASYHDIPGLETIKFPHVIANLGSAYNPNTCDFTCPVSGFYFFTATILSHEETVWHSVIENVDLNNKKHSLATMYHTDKVNWLQATNSNVVICEAGERVHVMNSESTPHDVQSSVSGRPRSTFSGFLMA